MLDILAWMYALFIVMLPWAPVVMYCLLGMSFKEALCEVGSDIWHATGWIWTHYIWAMVGIVFVAGLMVNSSDVLAVCISLLTVSAIVQVVVYRFNR